MQFIHLFGILQTNAHTHTLPHSLSPFKVNTMGAKRSKRCFLPNGFPMCFSALNGHLHFISTIFYRYIHKIIVTPRHHHKLKLSSFLFLLSFFFSPDFISLPFRNYVNTENLFSHKIRIEGIFG